MHTELQPDGRTMVALRDAAWIALVSLAAAIICIKYDLSEALLAWTRQHERLQLDELPAVLLVVAISLIWFSSRRYLEARRQLVLRHAIGGRLADALAENQRLAQQYVVMQEYERKALARDLHDELGQYLNVIKLDAVSIRDATERDAASYKDTARAVIDNVDRVYAVVANLIRQLRPAGFDELGVAAALESCVDDWRRRLPKTAVNLFIETDLHGLDENRGLALFRLVQEAMTNVARHSQAAQVDIRIARRQDALAHDHVDVSILDNGRGVDLRLKRAGLGLVGMRERVAAFGGTMSLSSSPGFGFHVLASVPFP